MSILASDTSTSEGSVALRGPDGRIITEYLDRSRPHSETLLPAVQDLLERAGSKPGDIKALAAGTGPGTFTGLRVGLATLKGWAAAGGMPLIPVGSLDAVAIPFLARGLPVAVVSDARKDQVFAAYYPSLDPHGLPLRQGDVVLLELEAARAWLRPLDDGRTVLTGTGLCRLGVKGLLPDGPRSEFEGRGVPDASWILVLAEILLSLGGTVSSSELTPVYVRPPDARRPGPGKIVTV